MGHSWARVQISVGKVYLQATGWERSSLACLTSFTVFGQAGSNPPEYRRGTGEPPPVWPGTWAYRESEGTSVNRKPKRHGVYVGRSMTFTGLRHQESLG